ncbi:hypothetical protein SM033_00160 [Vibrio phage vB_VpaM_sm033]|nr:hypothetical protein SM033_00160 [Vibrio phage vB_VpaM_sm033]
MQVHIYDLMKEDLQVVISANTVLGRLWRYFLYEMQVRPSNWDILLTNYTAKARAVLGEKEATNLKGNLPKRLACEDITFKNLCRGISVFDFPRVVLRLTLTKDGITKDIEIDIPPTYGEEGGKYLKVLWNTMIKEFPYCVENWKEHVKAYAEYCKKVEGAEVDKVSNLPRALDADALTWNSFYKGFMIHNFDGAEISLDLYKRSSAKQARSIRLVVKSCDK